MEVICIDDKYPVDTLKTWELYGVSYPILDKMYNIREAIRHFDGSIGVRVEEIINPPIPIKHPVLGNIFYEPTFAMRRFAKLNGDLLEKEEVEELTKLVITPPSKFDIGLS
jgi:hypothetical protein